MFSGITGLAISGLQPASPQWVGLAGLCALMVGVLMFVARFARLGFLANFLSQFTRSELQEYLPAVARRRLVDENVQEHERQVITHMLAEGAST